MFLYSKVFEIVSEMKYPARSFLSACFFDLYKSFAWETFKFLGFFTWPVYVRTYCVCLATLNQNKRSRKLFLGNAQIIT